jgi:EAL domain-containing protein (putative c-di-GMP-specific phosphodiesterase class I)
MARHALPAGCLELELTEGMLMADLDETLYTLHALKESGARLAIDDFGTGYSSLSYLTRFPIDVLKIDRSFICGITSDASQLNITRAIISMAHSLKLEVVAEGVEYAEQAELLKQESCDLMQGYLYGRPMPAEEFTHRLANRVCPPRLASTWRQGVSGSVPKNSSTLSGSQR